MRPTSKNTTSVSHDSAADRRRRRRSVTAVRESLRDVGLQLSLLNRHVGARIELKGADFDCLEVLNRYGPLTPSALAKRAGQHPATMTGILDRLQRAGWITRDRDPNTPDRRAVTIRPLPDRAGELSGLYAGLNSAVDRICAGYTEAELELIAEFLRRTAEAGRDSTERLAGR